MKVAVVEFGYEANSFARPLGDFARVAPDGWEEGEKIKDYIKNRSSKYLVGMSKAAEEEGLECIYLPSIRITAGPSIRKDVFEEIVDKICTALEKCRDEIDGVCFANHGATCSEDIDDADGYILGKFREIIGPDKPMMASADLHANVSPQMIESTNGYFGIKEYPHNDRGDAGYFAMKNLAAKLKGKLDPKNALVKLPLIFPVGMGSTFTYPVKEIKEYFADYCKKHGLIDTTFFHGFPQSDGKYTSVSVVAIADGYAPTEHAKALAQYVWNRRNDLLYTPVSADEALNMAAEYDGEGYVVINEPSDNRGSGAPGDGTHLLRALIEHNIPGSIFEFMIDREVAHKAYTAGVGAKIDIKLGAKTDDLHGTPIELSGVEVLAVSEGNFIFEAPMSVGCIGSLGETARLRYRNVEIIVSSWGSQTMDNGAINCTGGDPDSYKIICLKSANHFRSYFETRAGKIIAADTPGSGSNDLKGFDYRRLSRPIFPLDSNVEFSAE